MTVLIASRAAIKLAKVCALFSSNHDGEVTAAAKLADRIVRDAGLNWHDIISMGWKANSASTWASTVEGKIGLALGSPDCLNDWERRFLLSLSGRRLTLKQADLLDRIVLKVTAFNAARGRK
jgi:hypothetical protein